MSDLEPHVVDLADAIQRYVNVVEELPGALVTQAFVVYEVAGVNEEGDTWRRVAYAIPTDNFSISGAIGLAVAGKHLMCREGLDNPEPED